MVESTAATEKKHYRSEIIKNPTTEENIAQASIPYPREDNRARFLGLRSSGFTYREAIKFMGLAESTVSMWRRDPTFVDLEKRIPEYRKELSREYIGLEFTRNFRMLLKKDYNVIKKSLEEGLKDAPKLTYAENQYLLKARQMYTPQQWQMVEAIVGMGAAGFDFTKIVQEIQRERATITVER